MKSLPLGSIASNLESPRAVYIICLSLLSDLAPAIAEKHKTKAILQAAQGSTDLSLIQRYQLGRAVDALIRDLNRHVPPLTYFGYQITDKTNLGVWVDLGALHAAEQAGVLTQVIGLPWRDIKSLYVLDVGGAGLTLYRRRDKKVIWSVA